MGYDQQLLKGTVSIMVLKLLCENDFYGYEILGELERRSDNVFTLNEGALYPILHKLENEGHISSYWEEQKGRKRKYYHLTPHGKKLFESKYLEWLSFSKAVNLVLGEKEKSALSYNPNVLFPQKQNKFIRNGYYYAKMYV